MSNHTHTPGPWHADEDDTIVRLSDGTVIDCIRHSGEGSSVADGADYANALLVAAAPNMLAALLACVEPTEPGEDCPLPAELYNLVCAAITKVDG